MSTLVQRWGLGAELSFSVGSAVQNMRRAGLGVRELQADFGRLKDGLSGTVAAAGQLALGLAPIGALTSLFGAQSSKLAADLEANQLTMRVLLGSVEKSEDLIARVRKNAAETPFEVGDLIEGSKRLLRLTGDNVDANMELLGVVETMTALNPTKNIVDAVEGVLDATSGGGFERLKEFGLSFRSEDFAAAGRPGGKAWADAVTTAIAEEMKKKTRGENLVAALAETFQGRASTLTDSINAVLTEIGIELNRGLKVQIIGATDAINELAPLVSESFRELFGELGTFAQDQIGPVVADIRALWDGLGEDGQKGVIKAVIAFEVFATAVTTVGGVLGFVGFMLSGVIALFTNLWAVGGALFGLLSSGWTMALPGLAAFGAGLGTIAAKVLGVFLSFAGGIPIVGGLIDLVLGAGVLLFGVFGPVTAAVVGIIALFALFSGTLDDLISGIWYGLAPAFESAWASISGPLSDLWVSVQALWDSFTTGSDRTAGALFNIGAGLGWAIGLVVRLAATIAGVLISAIGLIFDVIGPLFGALRGVFDLLLGVVGGTYSVGDAFNGLVGVIVSATLAIANGVIQIVAWVVQQTVGLLADLVGLIPGGSAIADGLRSVSDAVGGFRSDFGAQIGAQIAGVNTAGNRQAEAEVDAAALTSDRLGESPVDVTIETYPTSTVEIDGKEVARSQGKQAAKAGERGTGPKLPAEQRGRVLRNGLEITPLATSEVL